MRQSINQLTVVFMLVISMAAVADGNRSDIHSSAQLVQPLLPGMQAPAFTVRDVRGNEFNFEGRGLEKPLVLTFYRGGWCPYCNLHLSELRHVEEQLQDMGFNFWFISIDKPEMLLETLDDPDIGYTIFSDSSLDATRSFGLAFRVDDELYQRYLGYDIDLERASGESHHVLPAPATYIIGIDGVITFAYINPDYKVRLHPDVLLAAATTHKQDMDARLVREYKQRKQKE
jgi:peroxiredoxin